MKNDDIYTITQISGMLGISDATVRKYEKDYDMKIPRNELGHRFYTTIELEVFRQIISLKEQGANIHVIKKILSKSVSAEEQKEHALELVTLDKLTGLELKELMIKQISELMIERESQLTEKYKEKLEEVKEEIRKEIKGEFNRHQEQREIENKKLMDYIAIAREDDKKKGFLSRLLGK